MIKNLYKGNLCVVILFLAMGISFADTATPKSSGAAAFLRNGSEPQGIALGGAYSALVSHSDSIYWNPAGMGVETKQDIQLLVSNAYEANFSQCNALLFLPNKNKKKKKIPIGLMVKQASMDGIKATALNTTSGRYEETGQTLSYLGRAIGVGSAVALSEDCFLGYSISYIQESGGGYSAHGFGADFGLQYRYSDHLRFGTVLRNAVQPIMKWNTPEKTREVIPREWVVGSAYTLRRLPITFSSDVACRENREPELRLGAQLSLSEQVPVWVGSNNGEWSVGTGIMSDKLSVMLSWTKPKQDGLEGIYKFGVRFGVR